MSRGTNKNPARTFHFDALLDHYALIRLCDTVRHHPGRGATRSRASSRIFAVIENHAGVKTGTLVNRFTSNAVQELAAGRTQIFSRGCVIDVQPSHRV